MRLAHLAMAALAWGALATPAAAIDGRWLTEDKFAIIEMGACAGAAGAKCGRIVGMKVSKGDDGKPLKDVKNPDAQLAKRMLCGLEVMSGFKLQADGVYGDGLIYDPEEGKSYKGEIKPDGETLKVTGYLVSGVKLLSDTDVWTKAPAAFEACATK